MLQFLLDVNVASSVRRFLEAGRFDVACVADLNPRMTDEHILRLAYREDRILITIDKDFGDLIYNRRLPHKGVIRLEDTKPVQLVKYLETLLSQHASSLHGSVVVAARGIIRIRDLES